MPQGKSRKALSKRARKGNRGYPMATVAFYGPDNRRASKVVCSILDSRGAEPRAMEKWFTESDGMRSERILAGVLAFIDQQQVVSVVLADQIIGCPHEEGIDYPAGGSCPQCSYWHQRDRFSHQPLN